MSDRRIASSHTSRLRVSSASDLPLLRWALFACALVICASANGAVTVCDEASLRAAMQSGGTVTFACDGTITLTSTLVVTNDTVLDATSRQITLSGGDAVRILDVTNGVTLTVRGLTLANGRIGGTNAGGGAIHNRGSLVVDRVTLENNSAIAAPGASGMGGAILNRGVLLASNSAFLGNVAIGSSGSGGAIGTVAGGKATLVNCTLAGNRAASDGSFPAGAGSGGAIIARGNTFLTNCTIALNSAMTNFGGGVTLGAEVGPAILSLHNCILADNSGGNSGVADPFTGRLIDGGHNMSSDNTCRFSNVGSLNNIDPRLGTLRNNGGATKTMALLEGSLAIDAGSSSCPSTDQRGVPRPVGPACDIGAFEGSMILPRLSHGFTPPTIIESSLSTLAYVLENGSGMTFSSVAFTNNLPAGVFIADPANATTSCGGIIQAIPGTSHFSLYSASLAASQTCVVAVQVTSHTPKVWTNPAVTLYSAETGDGYRSGPSHFTVFGKPQATTKDADNIVRDGARLNATVDPGGFETHAWFEFGTSTDSLQPIASDWTESGFGALFLSMALSNLNSGSNYFFRVVATNQQGASYGAILSFYTLGKVTLTNCDETGLQSALSRADILLFGCDDPITLSGPIWVRRDLTIDGDGRNAVISGNDATRLFIVDPGVTLTLNGLTIANGRARGTNGAAGIDGESVCGGAILNNGGSVILSNCTLTNNQVLGGGGGSFNGTRSGDGGRAEGGAVCNLGGSVLISTSRLISNVSTGGVGGGQEFDIKGAGGEGFGGAVYSRDGMLTLSETRLVGNTSFGGKAGGDSFFSEGRSGSAFGGGLFVVNGSLAMTNSDVWHNNVVGRSPFFNGGAAGVGHGAGAYLSNCFAIIKTTVFATNTATGGGHRNTGADARGGAVFNVGELRTDESGFYGNSVSGGGGRFEGGIGGGGGVYNVGVFRVHASTFAGNQVTAGGSGHIFGSGNPGNASGGALYNAGTLLGTNLTVVLNRVFGGESFSHNGVKGGDGLGAGIFHESGSATINHVTIASNSAIGGRAPTPGSALGGGVCTSNSNLRLQNSILGLNTNGSNCFGPLIDDGNNISSDSSCPFTAVGSLSNTDPILAPLGDYGGPTPTMALLTGSPAIDHALASFCPPTDQRGWPRPSGATCDVGAFESGPPFSIRGTIRGFIPTGGIPVFAGSTSGVSIATGSYIVFGLSAGSYTAAPSSPEMIAIPNTRSVSVGPDMLGIDFRSYRFNGFTAEGYSNGVLHLIFAGTNTLSYEVQKSTNLTAWAPFSTNGVGADSIFHLFHTNRSGLPQEYFRTLGR